MLIQDISCFENTVDPDQPASEKPADLDPQCFHCVGKYINTTSYCLTGILQVNWVKFEENYST